MPLAIVSRRVCQDQKHGLIIIAISTREATLAADVDFGEGQITAGKR